MYDTRFLPLFCHFFLLFITSFILFLKSTSMIANPDYDSVIKVVGFWDKKGPSHRLAQPCLPTRVDHLTAASCEKTAKTIWKPSKTFFSSSKVYRNFYFRLLLITSFHITVSSTFSLNEQSVWCTRQCLLLTTCPSNLFQTFAIVDLSFLFYLIT